MYRDDRLIEKAILTRIDRLVKLLIDLSNTQESEKDPFYNEATTVIEEMRPLLLDLLGGQEQHLEPMIRQLVSQKLPQGPVVLSFGDLHRDLNRILSLVFRNRDKHKEQKRTPIIELPEEHLEPQPQPSQAAKEQEVKENPIETLEKTIRRMFPAENIVRDFSLRSLNLDIYLPQSKIGFVLVTPQYRTNRLTEHFLHKEGIKLVEVHPADVKYSRLLARKLRFEK